MNSVLQLLGGLACFAIGLRMSFFFSGMEIGFYRASLLRISLDAQSGEKKSQLILWFMKHPGYFVATILVGNNLANYLITLATTVILLVFLTSPSELADILATLAITPFIFIFGELLPKNLFYISPLRLLKANFTMFWWCYILLLPISFPIIMLTRFMQRWSQSTEPDAAMALSRNRLVQVVEMGEQEGVVGTLQNQLVQGFFHKIDHQISSVVIPLSRIYGVSRKATKEEIFSVARNYGLNYIPVFEHAGDIVPVGYYDLTEVMLALNSLEELVHELPVFSGEQNKFEVLVGLRNKKAALGLVKSGEHPLGMVSELGIVEQMFAKRNAIQVHQVIEE